MRKIALQFGFFFLIFSILVSVASAASPDGPSARVKAVVEDLKSFVKENTGKMSEPDIDKNLESKVKPLFDFSEMARRSLGASWNDINADQQKEFIDLFGGLLSRTYLAKIREGVRNSDVTFGEERLKGSIAIVDTVVVYTNDKLSISYRLYKKGGKWLVYDVVIENIGIVSNYRDEFAGMMRKGGFASVMEQLRSKESANAALSGK